MLKETTTILNMPSIPKLVTGVLLLIVVGFLLGRFSFFILEGDNPTNNTSHNKDSDRDPQTSMATSTATSERKVVIPSRDALQAPMEVPE